MHFVLSRARGGRWTWSLHSNDDQEIVRGRTHATRIEALVAVGLVQGAPANGCRCTTRHDAVRRQWSWRVVTRNGWLVAQGNVGDDPLSAERALQLLAGTTRATPVLIDEAVDTHQELLRVGAS
jgi:uncharacterized protein YegP (UPF0339 family)